MEVDLHIHTTFSDGTYTPEEVIKTAIQKNMKALAITDHDNIDGLYVGQDFAKKNNFELINGIEFSCNIEENEVHILGYFLNLEDKIFLERIENLLLSRDERNNKIIKKLQDNDIMIELEDVKLESSGRILGRPHFARALMKKDIVESIPEAFDKYLGRGGLAYVPRVKCSPELAVQFLKDNGAFASLAHPKFISKDENFTLNLIKKLKEYGLDGIETNYSLFEKNEISKYKTWAKKFDLITTGGSDFHGENRKNIFIGQAGVDYQKILKIKKYLNII
ncbi:MAG: PHP domain-containing protein [Fusobacterium sp.]|nr:PHP domain-containing protein [Fusobacterium sp.]